MSLGGSKNQPFSFYVSHFPLSNLGCSLLLPWRPQWTQPSNQFALLQVQRRKALEDFCLPSSPTTSDRAQSRRHEYGQRDVLMPRISLGHSIWNEEIWGNLILRNLLRHCPPIVQILHKYIVLGAILLLKHYVFSSFIPHKAVSSPTLMAKTNLLHSNQYAFLLLNCRARR